MPSFDPDTVVIDDPSWLLRKLVIKPVRFTLDGANILVYLFAYLALGLAPGFIIGGLLRSLDVFLICAIPFLVGLVILLLWYLSNMNRPINLGQDPRFDIEHFKKRISLMPKNASLRLDLVTAYQRAGHLDMAMMVLEDLLKSNPVNKGFLVILDDLLDDINDTDLAMTTWNTRLESATAIDQERCSTPRIHRLMIQIRALMMDRLGAWLMKQNKTSDAERILEESIRLYPGDNIAWLRLAQLLINKQEYANAVKLLLEAYDAVPGYDITMTFLGDCYFRMGEAGKARDVLNKVTARNPRNADLLVNVGYAYNEAGFNEEALRTVLAAKALKPRHPTAWVNHSVILLDMDRLDEAIGVATQAMAFGNSILRSLSLGVIGDALYLKNQIDESRAAYDRALRFNGKNAGAHFGLLRGLLRKGYIEGAVAKIVDIQVFEPDSYILLYAHALCLVAEGKRDEAIQCLQQAVSKKPLLKTDLKKEPLLDPIRLDPRFLGLIES